MTRVSDNSGKNALNYAVNRAKQRLEDLQIKGSSFKRMTKPSDDPSGNLDLLTLKSRMKDTVQYKKNIDYVKTSLDYTETAIEELTDIMIKAKEMAIAQSSDLYNESNRKNIAQEAIQLKHHALSIANRRMGNRYIFGGFTTLTRPFDAQGNYLGDDGKINVEVAKDFFIPINLTGREVFHANSSQQDKHDNPLGPFPRMQIDQSNNLKLDDKERMGARDTASLRGSELTQANYKEMDHLPASEKLADGNIMQQLDALIAGLETNNKELIKDLLEQLDQSIDRVISVRTKIGALYNSIGQLEDNLDKTNTIDANQRSKIEDADVAELFSELARQQNALTATYKSGQSIINRSLIDFLR